MFIVLSTFVGFTTSVFSASYIAHELETGRLTHYLRFYHAMYQVLMFGMNLALLSNNVGLMWVAVELATLTTVLMVGIIARPPRSRRHGSTSFSAASASPWPSSAPSWSIWRRARWSAKAWMPWPGACSWKRRRLRSGAAQSCVRVPPARLRHQGRARAAARLAARCARRGSDADLGSALGVAAERGALRVLRFKIVMSANPGALAPGPLMVALGLLSVLFASFMLYRRQDIKRMFAYSSIEHMGIVTFAFGMGGALANFAGLLHMTLHSLTKSAIFFCVGHIAQVKGTQRMADIRGLTVSHPVLGWGLVVGVVAIAGIPPMGIFMTEFLIVTSTFARQPVLAVLLGLSLLVALGALLARLNGLAFGDPHGSREPAKASFVPVAIHFALVLAAGIWLPATFVAWFQHVAALLR